MLDLCHNDIGFKGASALAKCLQQRCLGGFEADWRWLASVACSWSFGQVNSRWHFSTAAILESRSKRDRPKKSSPVWWIIKFLVGTQHVLRATTTLGLGDKNPIVLVSKNDYHQNSVLKKVQWFQFQRIKEIPGIRVDSTSPSAMEHPQVRWNIPNWNQF